MPAPSENHPGTALSLAKGDSAPSVQTDDILHQPATLGVDPSAPILLFDSGVGGLTVLDAVRRKLPDAPLLYAADTAGLPYGTKTESQIAARVAGLLGRMTERFQPRLVCIACNTASTIALGMVREVLEVPIVGTVPAIKPAAAMTRSGVIGLLGTQATIRQNYIDRLEQEFAFGKRLLRHGAPALVAAAEAKLRGEPVNMADVEAAVTALRDQPGGDEMDTIILACTHFPLLQPELREICGESMRFVDGASGIADQIARLTSGQAFQRIRPDRAVFTAPPTDIKAYAATLERYNLAGIDVL